MSATWRRPWVSGLLEALTIATAAAVSLGVVRLAVRDALLSDLRNHLGRTVELVAALVDGDVHATLTDSSQTGSPEYEALVQPLETLLRINPDIRYAYTGLLRGDSMYFVLDGDRSAEGA